MPAKYKFSSPTTIVHRDDKMGVIENEKYTIKVVLGELFGKKSKIELLSPAFYYHINLKPDARLDIPTNPLDNAFIYVVKGSIEIEGHRQLNANQIALYQRGDHLINMYSKDGADLLLLGGQPLNEPVFSYGPFVMNTKEEINQCIANYRSGKMGDPNLVN
jgi:redox-sensitive bicupin YhaK (pirin superfamily)